LGEGAWREEDEERIEDAGLFPTHAYGKADAESLQAFLDQQSKMQLIALIEDLAQRYQSNLPGTTIRSRKTVFEASCIKAGFSGLNVKKYPTDFAPRSWVTARATQE
jgi:hypothetical protein